MHIKRLIEEITLELLNEVKLEDVMQQFNSKKMKKAVARNEEWNEKKIERFLNTPRFQELFLNFIPEDIEDNDRAEGLQWILGLYKKDKLGSIRRWTKDLVNKHKSNLELFFQQKRFMKQKQLQKLDLESLGDVVDKARPEIKAHLEKKSYLDADQGKKVILDNENWTVYIPTNKGAACELGKGTDWCTAAPGLNYYEEYHSKEDPLIIFIPKNPSYKGEKYQFHFGSQQFMDEEDSEVDIIKLIKLTSLLAPAKKEFNSEIQEKIEKVEYKKLKNGVEYTKDSDGHKEWYLNGKYHREDGPAIEYPDGTKAWFLNGKRHRENGPAIEQPDGTKEWYLNGKLHREDGPAIEEPDGYKAWWLNDKRHREDGPAIEQPDGTKEWYLNGKYHREDGPAVVWPNGAKFWFLNGEKLSEKEHAAKIKEMNSQKNISETIKELIEQELEETIKKIGNKYVVYPKKGGDRLGTHKTKKAAKKQLAAIEISKAKRGK